MAIHTRYNWAEAVRLGVIAAVVALSLCLIGMVVTFDDRDIIGGVVSLGQIFLFGPAVLAGYVSAQRNRHAHAGAVHVGGLIIGLVEPFAARYIAAGYSQIAPYLILFLVLVFRPHGIIAQVHRKKV